MIVVADAGPIIHLSLVGLLREAKRRGEIAEVAPVVTALRSQGVWLSDRLVLRILDEVGERSQEG